MIIDNVAILPNVKNLDASPQVFCERGLIIPIKDRYVILNFKFFWSIGNGKGFVSKYSYPLNTYLQNRMKKKNS